MKKEILVGLVVALVFLIIPFTFLNFNINFGFLRNINTFFSKMGLAVCGGFNTICATFVWKIGFYVFFMIVGFLIGFFTMFLFNRLGKNTKK
jgi:hypothetical protein